ncbi:hypothetical protein PILCRDRAFT_824921 [Piloderma croceum F 1598]|uniref:Uncharacterized protein n=1 Tax=Piloderma croceum (strain F 1598) TaxID=765440 RepID=A0A0C3BKR9_PILCF|nr:hypothetical protein PILCRDRAFT_824921 [Piloderma croceum F 1598]
MVMFFSSNDRMTAHNFEASVPEQICGVRSRIHSISSLPGARIKYAWGSDSQKLPSLSVRR